MKLKFKKQNWNNENIQFIGLFLLAILFVYKVPFILNQAFFLVVLYLAYKSKKDYFWIAFFFLLIDAPGNLFTGGNITEIHRLAYYKLIPGVTIGFTDLYIIVMMIKLSVQKKHYYFKFKNDIAFLLIVGIIVFAYSLIIGMSGLNIVQTVRIFLGWFLFFLIPRFLLKENDFDNLLRLLLPFVFVAVISQLYSYIFGNYFAYDLKGEVFGEKYLLIDSKEGLSRAADSTFILFYCFINALIYIYSNNRVFSKSYLYSVIFFAFLSVFLSATRGWILCYLIVIIFSAVFIASNKKILRPIFTRAIIILLIVISVYPKIVTQIENSFNRLKTVQDVAAGDLTAQGTLSRLDVRGPRVLAKFSESPVFGWGFSNNYFAFTDKHVGSQNLLLNVGILGFIIINAIFLKWCINIYRISKFRIHENRHNMNSINIFMFGLFGIYLVHLTSAQAWGFDISVGHLLFYSLILQKVSLVFLNQNIQNKIEKFRVI